MRQNKVIRLDFNDDSADIISKIHIKLDLNKKFQSSIKKVRNQFRIEEAKELNKKEQEKLFNNVKLISQSKKLTAERGLQSTWEPIVREYIILNGYFGPLFDPDALYLEVRTEDKINQYYLRIFPDTSLGDIKEAWKRKILKIINPSGIKPRKRKQKLALRNLEIYYAKERGDTISEIYHKVNKKYPKKDKRYDIEPEVIKTTISNLKKLSNK